MVMSALGRFAMYGSHMIFTVPNIQLKNSRIEKKFERNIVEVDRNRVRVKYRLLKMLGGSFVLYEWIHSKLS